ncbi:calcium-binding protein [Allorhizocola rhizosphaerae]|uniref:calcium-binding protein n=1 Tax=Allorhizocola rhizosphaerae TaxID=1872709 RepID=UPI000E3B8384|nr:calcium-binding protein [Allorhizocola rhizosphaerae]
MRLQRFGRALCQLLAVAVAVPIALVVAVEPAKANPPEWETGLKQVVQETAGWAEAGLSRVGQLAAPLPLLDVSPGSLVDADKLVKTVSDALAAHGLTNDNRDLGGGARLFSGVSDEADGGKLLDVVLLVKKTANAKDFTVAGITAASAVDITGWATLRLKAKYLAGQAFLVKDGDAPRLDIDAVAHFRADLSAASASVGILEVALLGGETTLTASSHFVVKVNDPNGDGKLAFGAGGELSASGSLSGLLHIGLDSSGGGKISDTEDEAGPGSVNALIKLGAAATGAPLGLPTLDATISVSWPNIGTGTPNVTTTGLDGTIAKFRNMSPLDIASGLAQLATLLAGVQQSKGAGNLDLPFLKGTFADATKINEKVVAFLKKWVHPKPDDPEFVEGVDDPARAGEPKFTSIQQLLKLLSDEGLLANVPLEFAGEKLAFTITLARSDAEESNLDPGGAEVSGKGATFTPSGFTLGENKFEPHALKGQRVVAGTSAGTIADNTANSITLTGEWIGGRPADDSTWVISSSEPHTGSVQLGGLFTETLDGDKKVGLRSANAQLSLAKVKPSYSSTITLVLDLRDDLGSPTANADRVHIRTTANSPLFAASFPISSQIDFFAKVGFLKVRINGSLAVGPVNAGENMLEVRFKNSGDISLGTLFQQLKDNPAGLFAITTSVRTSGSAKMSVPGDTGVLGEGVGASFSWIAGGEPVINLTNLDGLFKLDFNPDDPNALFALVVEALKLVNNALATANGGSGLLDLEIPLVGKSGRELLGSDESGVGAKVTYTADGSNFLLKDAAREGGSAFTDKLKDRTVVIGSKAYRILDFVDGQTLRIAAAGSATPENGAAYAVRPELLEAVDRLLANPPETLQDALDMVNKAIGTGSGVSFRLDQREGGPYLRIGLDWKRKFRTAAPLAFAWSGVGDLVTLDSSGNVSLDISGDAQLGLLLPLRFTDVTPLLDHNSSASITVAAAASNVALAARAGPVSLELGKEGDFASVQANLKFGLGTTSEVDKPVVQGLLDLTPALTTDGTDCGGGIGGANVPLCARAPVFLNDCDPPAGTNILSFQIDMSMQTSSTLPDLGPCLENLILKLTDFNVGIDGYLAKLEEALRLASFDGKLPLVGEDLQQGQRFIHQLREDIKAKFGEALATAPATNQGLEDVLTAKINELGIEGLTVNVTCREGVTEPCSLNDLQAVHIKLTKAKGAPSKADGCSGDQCLQLETALDLGIPGLSLKAKKGATDGVQVKLGWKLHLDMVLDRTEGFYIATHAGPDASPELQIGASFDTGDLDAQLAFIQVSAAKKTTTPLAHAYFAIDLKGSPGEESCFDPSPCTPDDTAKLTLGEFGDLGSLIKTQLTANVNIDWELTAKINPGSEVGSALPGISARFKLTWGISNHTGTLQAGNLDISFDEIAIDVGAFFTKIFKPILSKLKSVTGPLQPVIDTLYAPIPVLSDLSRAVGGPDITLIWLAEQFSTLNGGPKLDFVHTIRAVIEFINRIPNCTTSCKIPLGAFDIRPDRALDTLASPAAAESLITNPQPVSPESIKTAVDQKSDGAKLFEPDAQGKSNAQKTGFSFPIFDKPASLFGLLLGQDVELVSFDSGPLELGFSWRQSFGPVYAPPPVFITLSGSASVTARFIMGLDTKGIRHAIEAATDGTSLDAVSLLDGLYFKTHDASGKAVPVVTLTGEIAAGAEVSVVILKVGIEGGIRLTVGFNWNDPNNDGKFRTSEFLQRLLVNPICLFTTSGQLSVFLRVYITIDLFLFKKKWSFTLVNAVLLDFRAQPDCEPPPPELGGVSEDTLVIFAGNFGKEAQRGDKVWDNTKDTYNGDVIKVYALHYHDASDDFDGFAVEGLGRKQEFLDKNLKRVVVDGKGYNAGADKVSMSLLFLGDGHPSGDPTKAKQFDKTVVVRGSDGADNIRTGTGPSYVDGGLGDDTIVTADQAGGFAWVAGGGGNDNITTGEGNSIVAGDSSFGAGVHTVTAGGKQIKDIINWNALSEPSPDVDGGTGADTITVGHGSNRVYGNGGDDVLGVMVNQTTPNGSNTVVGGLGADTINGGNGDDFLYAYSQTVPSSVDDAGEGDVGLVNNIDTAGGEDVVHGSAGVELVTSHSANNQTGKIYGYGANDVLLGGFGTDQIFGGPGDDYVIAEPAEVGEAGADDGYGPLRTVTHTPLPAGVQSQTKLLVGGLDRDHIIGGDGGATIFGDKYLVDETCADNNTFAQVTPSDQGAADLILGGDGVEVVSAGSGNDRSDLGNGADRACGQRGDDVLNLGAGNDKGWGGPGGDQILGDSGDDFVYGNEDNDGLYGGDDIDTIEGNGGNDSAFGGTGNDRIYGGSRAAAALDGSDHLYGEDGTDAIVGDNGDDTPYPYDLDGLLTDAGAGDVIFGGAQNDRAFGGLGPDVMQGNENDDYLEGNNDSDTVNGNTGKDQIIGGSSVEKPDVGDFLFGDADEDLIAGDNAVFADGTPTRLVQGRSVPQRAITLLGVGGADLIEGGSSDDVLLAQHATDRVKGGSGDDYAEGGQGIDWVEGNLGNDDLVGGSHTGTPDEADALFGGAQSDVMLGDNGVILRLLPGDQPTSVTVRVGSTPRIVSLLDTATFGDDRISGENGVDMAWGQDGSDFLSGGGDGDYAEGNGGADTILGDAPIGALDPQPWPGSPTPAEPSTPDGQDDLIGGSTRVGFRDAGDVIRGNGHDDVLLGDNGSLLRTIVNGSEKVYTERYPTGADLTQATVVRTHDPALPGPSTRFCTAALLTCEPGGAFGGDQLFGDGGNDGVWGQDGDDTIYGGDGNDDLFGELGADTIFGEAGEDAILGDRGGVVNQHLNADDVAALGFTLTLSMVPQETFTGFRLGSYDRRVDLLADTDGDTWIDNTPHNGLARGDSDLIRGGSGDDNIHGGWGNDLINGDSGGDDIFGSHGSDVLWGGKGCDPVLDAATPDCLTGGVFNPDSRGLNDRFIDHTFGGSGESIDEAFGSDLLDMKPRGEFATCVAGRWPVTVNGTTFDPCVWFTMTDMHNASIVDNQHHQGTDWIYGGWDRDAMQADVAQNGPNAGDRLMDWNGAYNLYTHCNAAYGGYNDIRQHSPSMQEFLTMVAWASGAGRTAADVTTAGTSAFRELAYTYQSDTTEHGAGRAYPGTPGHFDDPVSCTD